MVLHAENTVLRKLGRILEFMKFAVQTSPQCGISCDKKNFKKGYLWISGKGEFIHSLFPCFLEPWTSVCTAVNGWLTAPVSENSLGLQGPIFQFKYHGDQFLLHSALTYLQTIFPIMFKYNKNETKCPLTKVSSLLTVLVKHWCQRDLKTCSKEFLTLL